MQVIAICLQEFVLFFFLKNLQQHCLDCLEKKKDCASLQTNLALAQKQHLPRFLCKSVFDFVIFLMQLCGHSRLLQACRPRNLASLRLVQDRTFYFFCTAHIYIYIYVYYIIYIHTFVLKHKRRAESSKLRPDKRPISYSAVTRRPYRMVQEWRLCDM